MQPTERITEMQARIDAEVDPGITLDVRYADEIAPTASGKRMFVVNACG